MKIQLDWRAYFQKFCDNHGQPLMIDGRLLFPDGWRYSATNHLGPEWPPPKDEKQRNELIKVYWTRRLELCTYEHRALALQRESLTILQSHRELPLQHRMTFVEDGKRRHESADLNLEGLDHRIQCLADDMVDCSKHLGIV